MLHIEDIDAYVDQACELYIRYEQTIETTISAIELARISTKEMNFEHTALLETMKNLFQQVVATLYEIKSNQIPQQQLQMFQQWPVQCSTAHHNTVISMKHQHHSRDSTNMSSQP